MGFFERASNGWQIAQNSFKVLKENKQLILFPVLSGISLLLIVVSFSTAVLGNSGWEVDNIGDTGQVIGYVILFLYYLVNYFVVVFFNTALTYCTGLYFRGEEVTVKKGIAFSVSRIGVIFSWAVFAATVGTILRLIQENVGFLGKILTGIVGVVFSVATFFVVPVLTYENLGPIAAFKRSAALMKQKWGESVGAGFTFFLIEIVAILAIAIPAFLIGSLINPFFGIAVGVLGFSLLMAVMSAVRSIFISAVYHNITGDPVENYNQKFVDGLFTGK
ncbi:MAG: DUF6159 family protein [Bacteroidota bacterium]